MGLAFECTALPHLLAPMAGQAGQGIGGGQLVQVFGAQRGAAGQVVNIAQRRLRARLGEGCVLIALSGYGQDSDRERAQVSGFAHYLVKPVEPAQLHALISSTPVDRG